MATRARNHLTLQTHRFLIAAPLDIQRTFMIRTTNLLRLPQLGRLFAPTVLRNSRCLSHTFPRANELNEQVMKPKKPLSRIPVGGSESVREQTVKTGSTVEFSTGRALVLFLVVGAGLTYFFKQEKKRLEIQREAETNRGMGKPLIGGDFNLVDHNGNPFTQEKLKGKFSVLYFGFSHCPDICPDELDKLGLILENMKKNHGVTLQPIFITCDPARDSPEVLKEYLSEFHPDIIGLTGDYDEIKKCCKNFRVYFSTPRDLKPGQDYLVDHSIFFYLMDPEGEFIDVLGRQYDAEGAAEKIKQHISVYVPKDAREKQKQGWLGFLFK